MPQTGQERLSCHKSPESLQEESLDLVGGTQCDSGRQALFYVVQEGEK